MEIDLRIDRCGIRTATELAGRIRSKEVSAVEVLDAHLRQIESVNPQVNAICTLTAEDARRAAGDLDRGLAGGEEPGPLHWSSIHISSAVLGLIRLPRCVARNVSSAR